MSQYSQIAVDSVTALKNNSNLIPVEERDLNAKIRYPDKLSAQTKSCPKSTFLGLCEEGLVSGVKAGSYTKSKLNKSYALEAISHLRINPNLSELDLWLLISDKKPNEQMGVVKALSSEGFIVE